MIFLGLIKNTFYANYAKDMPLSKHFYFIHQSAEIQNKFNIKTFFILWLFAVLSEGFIRKSDSWIYQSAGDKAGSCALSMCSEWVQAKWWRT